jgi:hypothetical protein
MYYDMVASRYVVATPKEEALGPEISMVEEDCIGRPKRLMD